MKTTQQKRDDRVKQMEGSQLTREYMIRACQTDAGDLEMALKDQMNHEFARALLMVIKRQNRGVNQTALDRAIYCLVTATIDIIQRQASQFPSEEELKENDDD